MKARLDPLELCPGVGGVRCDVLIDIDYRGLCSDCFNSRKAFERRRGLSKDAGTGKRARRDAQRTPPVKRSPMRSDVSHGGPTSTQTTQTTKGTHANR